MDSWKAIEVKRLWIDKKVDDNALGAAWSAAWSAYNVELEKRFFKLLNITPKASKQLTEITSRKV